MLSIIVVRHIYLLFLTLLDKWLAPLFNFTLTRSQPIVWCTIWALKYSLVFRLSIYVFVQSQLLESLVNNRLYLAIHVVPCLLKFAFLVHKHVNFLFGIWRKCNMITWNSIRSFSSSIQNLSSATLWYFAKPISLFLAWEWFRCHQRNISFHYHNK